MFFSDVAESFSVGIRDMDALYAAVLPYFTMIIRWLLPLLGISVLWRTGRSLLTGKNEEELWAWLSMPNGTRFEINHWENVIGRAKSSDIVLDLPTVSRSHAALIRDENGRWTVSDLNSKDGVEVNGKHVTGSAEIKANDMLSLGGAELFFIDSTPEERYERSKERTRPGKEVSPAVTLWFVTLFQALLALQLCMSDVDNSGEIALAFSVLCGAMWLFYFVERLLRRTGYEPETLAFFLCSIGFSVVSSAAPSGLFKQTVAMLLGIVVFIILSWFLRDLERAKKLRWPMAAAAVALLGINMLFGKEIYGARNWISLGGISFQPSELIKLAFIFAGAATLDRLFARRNLIFSIVFSGICVGALALMGDFGTALIFFAAFLVIAYMRSGDIATIALMVAGTGFAGMIVMRFKPYIANRFAAWRHVWEYSSSSGYQQTRTMSAAASGGMFGMGGGNGWLKNIAAADTDLVFGMVCEELGLIVALTALAALVILALFALKSVSVSRSSFYSIAACSAVSMLLFQTMLNVFGAVDILPLTGVTFPFVSNGGSSMLACWGMLAFIKANDTRQNASFAIKLPVRKGKRTWENTDEES